MWICLYGHRPVVENCGVLRIFNNRRLLFLGIRLARLFFYDNFWVINVMNALFEDLLLALVDLTTGRMTVGEGRSTPLMLCQKGLGEGIMTHP